MSHHYGRGYIDRPALSEHPAVALDNAHDRPGGGGVVIAVPAQVEGQLERFGEVALAMKQIDLFAEKWTKETNDPMFQKFLSMQVDQLRKMFSA